MARILCPVCGAEQPPDAEICQVCQASLANVEPVSVEGPQEHREEKEGFLPHAEGDLPELLRSLKQDGDLRDEASKKEADQSSAPGEPLEVQEDADGETELPDWLYRIRQRAQTEIDSAGEITQKLRAAQESLDDEKKLSQQRQFESLIDTIHGEDTPDSPGEHQSDEGQPDKGPDDEAEQADWLTRIRNKHQPVKPEEPGERLSNRQGDSLLQWLVALEDGSTEAEDEPDEVVELGDGVEDTQEVVLPGLQVDSTQEVDIGQKQPAKRQPSALTVSRAEQHRADQLSATIIDEKAPRPVRSTRSIGSTRWIRLAMGVVLIAVLSFALFFMGPAGSAPAPQNLHSLAALDWVDQLPAEASLLLVIEYQPGFSAEMEIIAEPILRQIWQKEAAISVLNATPSGGLLFGRLLEKTDLSSDLVVHNFGYFPVGSFGAFGLASQVQPTWQFIVPPLLPNELPTEPFDGILILGEDYEGSMAWVEQFSSLAPNTPILLLVSAQAGPLLQTYYESGQVVGILSGIVDAVHNEDAALDLGSRWRAYQVGIVMMIIVLLIGMSFTDEQRRKAGGSS
jgi:hypothetical protein